MRAPLLIVAVVTMLLSFLPLSSNQAETKPCRPVDVAGDAFQVMERATFEPQAMSPTEGLKTYDAVFFGEVLVPTRPCSLGQCAGIKVLRSYKGEQRSRNILVQTAATPEPPCAPGLFAPKGAKLMVFASRGTSRGGTPFLYVEADGPSFAALEAPEFSQLEASYQALRARLDAAIEAKLGRRTHLR